MTMNKTIIFLFLSLLFSQIKENEGLLEMIKNNSLQLENQKDDPIEKIYIQAKSLERAALYDEALTLYKQINNVQPGNRKYFKSLKKYLKEIEAWDTLFVYTNAFSKARNNDFQSKLELIDIYIWQDKKQKWKNIVLQIMKSKKNDLNSIKIIMQKLINNGQSEFAYEMLNKFRNDTNLKDFYSMEMGTFFGMRMAYEKAIDEYLIFLNNNPKKYQLISDRILAFPETNENILKINSSLEKSSLKESKFILADFKFKLKEYEKGYDLLQKNNAPTSMLLNYAKDLSSIKEYVKSEIILMKIIESNENEEMMTLAIFEIAKILESKILTNKNHLPISNFYSNNPFLSSPYIAVKEGTTLALEKSMSIYDSLRVTKRNAQATLRLAEVQFRILGDLDAAYYLYNEAYMHGNTESLRLDAALGMINVNIAKGDLIKSEKIINKLKKEHKNKIAFDIKLAQVNFYKSDLIQTDNIIKEIIKKLPLHHDMYNDMLNISSILIAFKENEIEFKKFVNIQLNIQQNNRIEAIEKLGELFNSNEIFISEMCRFQQAWLLYLQDDLINTKEKLQLINKDTIFNEMAHIFNAEILDYVNKDISKAIDSYLDFLDFFPNSIFYDDIRLRLRELAS